MLPSPAENHDKAMGGRLVKHFFRVLQAKRDDDGSLHSVLSAKESSLEKEREKKKKKKRGRIWAFIPSQGTSPFGVA
jgi:hypothetical protein